jgi:hypothetical protein
MEYSCYDTWKARLCHRLLAELKIVCRGFRVLTLGILSHIFEPSTWHKWSPYAQGKQKKLRPSLNPRSKHVFRSANFQALHDWHLCTLGTRLAFWPRSCSRPVEVPSTLAFKVSVGNTFRTAFMREIMGCSPRFVGRLVQSHSLTLMPII